MDFLSERGYFFSNPHAATGVVEHGELWKNKDWLRLKDEALFLVDPRPGMTVVEMGCANGANLVYCGLQGARVVGIDLGEGFVAEANEKLAHLGLEGEAMAVDASAIPLEDATVDAVLSSDFHEHLTPELQHDVLVEAWRLLKPGGVLVVKTPNLTYLTASLWFKRLREAARGRDPRGLVIPHTPGTPDPQHIGLMTHARMAGQLEAAGFDHYSFLFPALRRFGSRRTVAAAMEVPGCREVLCEDVLVRAVKPIALAHFPD